jgi:hypothetical protein
MNAYETKAFAELVVENEQLKAKLAAIKTVKPVKTAKPVKVAPVIAVTPELLAKVIAAAKLDKKVNGKYTSYTGFWIILKGVGKYGADAKFKDETVLTAAREYGLLK